MLNKRFVFLFLATLVSTLGSSLSYIAIYWNFSKMGPLVLLGLLTTVYFSSRFIFSLFLSPLADLYEPRALMRNTMWLRSLLLLLVGGSMFLFHLSYIWILLVAACQTAMESVYFPSSSKLVVSVVEEKDLSRANAILQTLDNIGSLVGLAVGAVAVTLMNLETILSIEGVAYLIGGILIASLPQLLDSNHETKTRPQYLQVWKEGLLYIIKHKWLLGILVVAICANFGIAPTVTLLAPYATDVLHGSSGTFSSLEMASVIGSIVAGLWLSKIRIRKVGSIFLFSGCFQAALILLLGLNKLIPLSMLLLVLVGFSISLFNTPFVTLLQTHVPTNMLGRVRGGLVAASKLASSLGYFLTGVISDSTGVSTTMLLFGAIGLLGIIIIAFFRPFHSLEDQSTPKVSM